MYKGYCKIVVIPTGEACKFSYEIEVVDGKVLGLVTDISIEGCVGRYIKNLMEQKLKNKEIKYKELKSQLLMDVEYEIDDRGSTGSKIINVEEIDIAYQRLLGGKLL